MLFFGVIFSIFSILSISFSISLAGFPIQPATEEEEGRTPQPLTARESLLVELGPGMPATAPASPEGEPTREAAGFQALGDKFVAVLHPSLL